MPLKGLLTPLLVLIISVTLAYIRRDYCVDDGFIFARIASNLAEGNAWSFNPGDPANAVTSPLWLVLLALLSFVTPLGHGSMVALFGLCVAAFGLGIYANLKARSIYFASAMALGCVALPALWEAAIMESALEFALISWTLFAYQKRRPILVGCLLGLCVLSRPDTGLLAILLAANDLLRRKTIPWKMTLAALVIASPWFIFSWIQFGSLTPDTLAIKTTQSSIGVWAEQKPFLIMALSYQHWCAIVLGITILALILNRSAFKKLPEPLWLLVLFGGLHGMAYQIIDAPALYTWYYIPIHLSLFIVGVTAWYALVEFAKETIFKRRFPRMTLLLPYSMLLPALSFILDIGRSSKPHRLTEEYKQAAVFVAERAETNDQVAAVEIGYLGYYSDCQVLDIHALIHKEAQAFIASGNEGWWLSQNPRFIITHHPPWFGEPNHDQFPPDGTRQFETEYSEVAHWENDLPEVSIKVWERNRLFMHKTPSIETK